MRIPFVWYVCVRVADAIFRIEDWQAKGKGTFSNPARSVLRRYEKL